MLAGILFAVIRWVKINNYRINNLRGEIKNE